MSDTTFTRASLEELLRFYAEAGVDDAIEDAPLDRFAAAAQPAPPAAASAPRFDPGALREQAASRPTAPSVAASVPDEAQAARAREAARSAATLEELRDILAGFEGCNLRFTAKSLVFADGNPAAPVMFVGEAPGREEDLEGLPFVGRSGQLLDRMLAAIGLDRTSAYIANVIPWRPPGNRDPSPMETEICRPFIERQIELVSPRVLVTLGNASSKALLRTQTGIMRLRGAWQAHRLPDGREVPLMPTLHPAYLLRNPAHKRLAWRDFLEIKARLRGEA